MEGFFYIAYTGSTGSGFGVLAFTRGVIAGADQQARPTLALIQKIKGY